MILRGWLFVSLFVRTTTVATLVTILNKVVFGVFFSKKGKNKLHCSVFASYLLTVIFVLAQILTVIN